MEIVNRRLSISEFRRYVSDFDFGPKPPDKLVLHHTWRPTKSNWDGDRSIAGLKAYYERKKWPAGPHLFVAEDGIWLFSSMRRDGIHATSLNRLSIGIEVVGDYDNEVWSGETKSNALGAIKVLMDRLGISESRLFFHSDVAKKTCPGRAISREWLLGELDRYVLRPMIPKKASLREVAESLSAPAIPKPGITYVPVPEWAMEAVKFVVNHQLFDIKNEEDIREAVKFYRFYQLIQKPHD